MTSIPMSGPRQDRAEPPFAAAPQHIAVQMLALLLFGGFAIVATVMAFVAFWPAGLALAIILGLFGFAPLLRPRGPKAGADWVMADWIKSTGPQAPSDRTGNASFDAYRTHILTRLEDEQKTFVGFLDRLRDAKDKSEFDTFMDDRANANHKADMSARDAAPQTGTGVD